jgi:oligoendopeptidase F
VTTTSPDQDAAAVEWDLAPLVDGGGDDAVASLLDEADDRATAFADAYSGKVEDFDSATLREAATELAEIYELVGRAGSYAMLRFAANTEDPATGALLQAAQEQGASIETKLLFFDLEWQALPEATAEQLLRGEGLEFVAHHLRVSRRLGPHRLSEP